MLISLGAWILGLCAVLVGAYDPMENPDLLQGDMELTEEQRNAYLNGEANSAVPLAAVKSGLWPKVIPYEVDEKLAKEPKAVEAIDAAIAEYHQKTCLRFVKRKNEQGYLDFYMGSGCSSPVGYYGQRSGISLSDGCWHKGIVMHEIAHSLGFYHEQSRPDRDHYVIIHWENIKQNMRYNFHKQKASNIDSMSVPYDYRSIMHYGRTAFGRGKLTIETRDPTMQRVIGRRSGFSDYDVLQMNLLYKCPGFTRPPKQSLPPSSIEAGGLAVGEITQPPLVTRPPVTATAKAESFAGEATQPPLVTKQPVTDGASYGASNAGVATQPPLVTRPPVTAPFTTPDGPDAGNLDSGVFAPGEGVATQPPLVTRPPVTGEATQPPLVTRPPVTGAFASGKDCKDIVPNCDLYKLNGFCSDERFIEFMRRNCPKTCDMCKSGVFAPGEGVATQPPLATRPPVTVPFTTPGEATQPPVVTRPPRTGGTKRPTNAPATGVVTNPPSAEGGSWSNVESDSDIPLETSEADELDYGSSELSFHILGNSEPYSDLDNENNSSLLFGVEKADPVCKLNDLIRREEIDKYRILYKFLNDVIEIHYDPFHKYDKDVNEFFNKITYLVGRSVACFIRGPMSFNEGRGSHIDTEKKKHMNLG
eukprot:gene10339-19037_t